LIIVLFSSADTDWKTVVTLIGWLLSAQVSIKIHAKPLALRCGLGQRYALGTKSDHQM